MELLSNPELTGVQAIVEAQTEAGRILTVRCDAPKGTPENPLTRSEIEVKFRKAARGRLAAADIESVLEIISHLEDLKSTRSMMDILRAGRT